MINKDSKKRIIDISYKNKLSHIGSCLTAVDIIEEIFSVKKYDEKFVLSSGHAGLALYVVLEKYYNPMDHNSYQTAEEIFSHHGVHPDRCDKCHLDCSSGSLGQGLPIAVGMALADRKKNVYCLISDGEMSEGSIAESLRIMWEQKLVNLYVYLNFNGYGAYKRIKELYMPDSFGKIIRIKYTNFDDFPFLHGLDAHYHVMDEEEYKQALTILQ